MAKVTGIGGVFFKARKDKKALEDWYARCLGMTMESWGGSVLRWPDDTAEDKGVTAWNVAAKDTEWFSPSDSSFMINYRVDDMTGILARIKEAGTPILKGPESHENGRFAWVVDPDGNKVELWEPKIWDDKNKSE